MNIKELAELIGDMAVEMTGDDYRAMFDAKHALLNQQAEITRLNARVAELERAASLVSDRLFKLVGCVADITDCSADIDAINALKAVIKAGAA